MEHIKESYQTLNPYAVEKSGTRIYCIDYSSNPKLVFDLRKFIKESYISHGYVGFSDDFDSYNDRHSYYLFSTSERGEVLAVLRIMYKENTNLLPFEWGFIKDESKRYAQYETNVADLNSFIFTRALESRKASKCLFGYAAKHMLEKGIKRAFGMYDMSNLVIKSVYEKYGAVDSEEFPKPIYFPGYGVMRDNEFYVSLWRIIEIANSQLEKLVLLANPIAGRNI
ncbi:hypothetical protein LEP1GSC058_1624 [Leptospira fainei serovar Hurstbridge str. BUT 6]|uniref:Acetyltransferase (GNAT) domain protein n=1 Tax=Leptospira fainei serovar Hurstbridge str. BUT 6 TaxID=1193011 RepID=S3VEG5_9LEPT|nr:hypothetical protein [Leptospira fainei]EPG74890.1 hypothetical protein LEP1GSC058_1624 [Leptospira fainei serovar Hurstbridge str. BUT 6]